MELTKALLSYLGVIIIVFLCALRIGIYPISAMIISLLVGQIILNIIYPPNSLNVVGVNNSSNSGSASALYILIQILTPILGVIYIFFKAFEDKKPINYCDL